MMGIDVLQKLLFMPLPSMLMNTVSFITFVLLANFGILEAWGKNLQYSKFGNRHSSTSHKPTPKQQFKFSSRVGMLVIYTPAFLAGVASFFIFPYGGLRFLLLSLALTIHFFKRIFEVLFVHKFGSNKVAIIDGAVIISPTYMLSTAIMIYTQHLSLELAEPSVDLKYAGVGLFLLGIGGNFYHHYILSKLRKEGEKEYKIPKGGLFNLVICPHYLFEVLGFVGVSCIAQTWYSLSFTAGSALYLIGRSYATRKWYLSKFEDFPKDVKALIPFIF